MLRSILRRWLVLRRSAVARRSMGRVKDYRHVNDRVARAMRWQAVMAGQGGQLLFFWVVGLGVLLFLPENAIYAAAWSALILAMLVPAVRSGLSDQPARRAALTAVLERGFPTTSLSDLSTRESLRSGLQVLVEIVSKVGEIERTHGPDAELRQVCADSYAMLALLYESATQAEELQRCLQIVGRNASSDQLEELPPGLAQAVRLRGENLKAITDQAARARWLAVEILRQLETLLLQVFQLEQSALDMVRQAELASEAGQALNRIQTEVDARREAAESVIQALPAP